jgi:Flp pilus assembly protein TadG
VTGSVSRLRARRTAAGGRGEDGVSLVEFTLLLPVFLLMLLGMLEFGLAFNHVMAVEYGTREGARTGSALGNGDTTG